MPKALSKGNSYVMNKPKKKAFYKELRALAIPIGMQNLLVALIGATDALMLGRLNQDSVAAVSLANQIVFVMNLFIGALVGGGGSLIAQYWGKGDRKMAKNLFCTILKYATVISLVFFGLAMLMPEQLMRIFTPEQALIDIGASYLRAVAVSYLFSGVTQCYYLMMKLEGKASKSVAISVVTLIADVVLDIFLIYGLAGVPKLGANGSAYSTVVVELIAFVWVIWESHRGESIRPDWQGFWWFSATITKDLFKIIMPMLASSLAWGLSISVHSFIMGHLGSDATAASSIASVAQSLVVCICHGIGSGAGIMVGKLLGQGMFDRAKAYGRKFCHISFGIGIVQFLILCLLIPLAEHFFLLTETASGYMVWMLLFTACYVCAQSVNAIITCGVFFGGGDAIYDAISVFFATWCFSIPLALLGAFVFKWPVMVVYILMCSDEIVKLPWIYPRYKKYLWLNNLTREETT